MKKNNLQSGRKKQKLKTRDKIIDAANQLLKSGQELNIDEVAKKAGVSRATAYRYYSSPELLASQLNLNLTVPDPEQTADSLRQLPLDKGMLKIQKQFLDFILENENSSRTFLSAFLSMTSPELKRGKNRLRTVQSFINNSNTDLKQATKEKLTHIAVLLMGIEAVIVTKDVCGLDEEKTKETLYWALEMILKGIKN